MAKRHNASQGSRQAKKESKAAAKKEAKSGTKNKEKQGEYGASFVAIHRCRTLMPIRIASAV
jgi:hypothetical protein